ncbi:sensor histidine kinase [Pontiella agarivorans]|uniref:histidine kinase n=1 Tax=Pontiella agarivorans TaxID=3038953 RepID=A0ABU5MSH0_9BACT|nr:ATP-binding protein [Pontiella agarivorans]MDZ8117058.1 histidine kinase [Pontiella agarivorans]
MDQLPQLTEQLQLEAYGYHGGYLPALDECPEKPRWTIEFSFWKRVSLTQVILVPAVDHRFGQLDSYGFPRRFRVLSVAQDGRTEVIQEWMHEDFPDPGRFPLVIDIPAERVNKIRIEVFRGAADGGREVFALDEFFGVRGVGTHNCTVRASSSLESPPYWGQKYLIDQRTSLGLPLDFRGRMDARSEHSDFSAVFDDVPESGGVVELDLGENRKLGWVTLYPAQPPEGIMIPGYGFPGSIRLEVVPETAAGERADPVEPKSSWEPVLPGNNIVHVHGAGCTGRWIRVYVDDFPFHDNKRTFAMGEIVVHRGKYTYSVQDINLEGFPAGVESTGHLLADGFSGGYPCMQLLDWIEKVELRNRLSLNLRELHAFRNALEMRYQNFWKRSIFGLLLLVTVIGVLSAMTEFLRRRRSAKRLRLHISSDLHDDVGSTLGSISMTAEQLEKMELGEPAGEILHDLSLMAREACASLREVIWVSDKTHTHLPELIQKLVERAERVLDGMKLDIDVPPEIPNLTVSLNTKRHFIMFYKEALHNCMRHAQASEVNIQITIDEEMLQIGICDNGCGFDTSGSFSGWGLNTMKKRAKELHGKVDIESRIGGGTKVMMNMPLKALSKEPIRAYKTSN